jgi:hypothetical protein
MRARGLKPSILWSLSRPVKRIDWPDGMETTTPFFSLEDYKYICQAAKNNSVGSCPSSLTQLHQKKNPARNVPGFFAATIARATRVVGPRPRRPGPVVDGLGFRAYT